MASRRKNSRPGKSGGSLLGFVGALFRALFILVLLAGTLAVGYYGASNWKEIRDIPDISLLERYDPIEAIQIFDINDRLVCTVEGDEDRRVVPLTLISGQMQQAMLAAEDHHFYEHHGVNFSSIGRAFLANMQAGHVVEGGSTITQQLVKNLFFSEGQRTMHRKLKEALLAWEIEQRYSKEKILEMYLNQVYFGNGAYGIERAASRYFGTSASALDLAQSAFLAGLVKAPSELSERGSRELAIARQREILDKMVEYGYVTADQAARAKEEKLVFKQSTDPLQKYPYYISYVLQLLRDRFSQAEIRRQGLHIYTNLDPVAQQTAEEVLEADIKKAPKGVSQGALVSVQVSDGSVVALVGGVGNFWKNQWNRATNPHTAGSSFKPFVYLTALRKGDITPDTMVEDEPITIKQGWGLPDWSPKNFDKKFLGKIPVRKALALSRNVCSVRIAQLTGIENVVETARLAGISTKLDPNLSLALGSSAVSPLDMAGAYSTFARGGIAIKPRVLRRIEDNKGQVIEVFEPRVDKVFPTEPVAQLVDIMQDVVRWGTGTMAKLQDRPVAGKTGTADEAKDIWFDGFTPDLVTVVWGGNDENLAIPGNYVTGGTVMAKIWRDFNQAYYERHPMPAGSFLPPTKQIEEEKKPEETPENGQPAANPQAPGTEGAQPEAAQQGEQPSDLQAAPPTAPPVQPLPQNIEPTAEPAPANKIEEPASAPAPAPAASPHPLRTGPLLLQNPAVPPARTAARPPGAELAAPAKKEDGAGQPQVAGSTYH